MKIAVASANGTDVSFHFGRSGCFVVSTVENGRITAQEVRDNPHNQGECQCRGLPRGDQPHNHAEIVDTLRDCEIVLCGGIGRRAAQELEAAGIRAIVVQPIGSARQAVEAYLSGEIEIRDQFSCNH
ncbi:MAG: NifB/NifX family molybdenum-iron cluster-binding protein [Thermogutta sp.]|jgi:predicted Fe-Mo cluster-binding NifX family protein